MKRRQFIRASAGLAMTLIAPGVWAGTRPVRGPARSIGLRQTR